MKAASCMQWFLAFAKTNQGGKAHRNERFEDSSDTDPGVKVLLKQLLIATLGRKLAEFGKVGQYSQRLKASAVGLLDLNPGRTLRTIQLVRQKVGHINGYSAIETSVRYACGMVVMRNGLDGKIWDAPQSQ
jgi:hypothetical protein